MPQIRLLIIVFLVGLPLRAGAQEELNGLLDRSAVVCKAVVTGVNPRAYDSVAKEAYTEVEFAVQKVLYGKLESSRIALVLAGGEEPDGTISKWTHVPQFVAGEKHLLFLRAGEYHLSPLASRHTFREIRFGARDIYVNENGRVVLDIGEQGFSFGSKVHDSTREVLARQAGSLAARSSRVMTRTEVSEAAGGKDSLQVDAFIESKVRARIQKETLTKKFYDRPLPIVLVPSAAEGGDELNEGEAEAGGDRGGDL